MRPADLIKLAFGFLALLFAAVGLFLPVWPTTPFVLAAVGCFSCTPQLQHRLLRVSWLREYYESYVYGRGVRRKTVAVSLGFLWGMLLLSMVLANKMWITLLLLAVGVAVTAHIVIISKGKKGKRRGLDESGS